MSVFLRVLLPSFAKSPVFFFSSLSCFDGDNVDRTQPSGHSDDRSDGQATRSSVGVTVSRLYGLTYCF